MSKLFPWLIVTEFAEMEPGVCLESFVDGWSIELLLVIAISFKLYFPEGCPSRLLVTPFILSKVLFSSFCKL